VAPEHAAALLHPFKVGARRKILILTGSAKDANYLRTVVQRSGFDPTIVTLANGEWNGSIAGYDAILINNVPSERIAPAAQNALAAYVDRGGSLAMMDAGVPLKSAVAGIAMGLVMDETTGKYAVLSDIAGAEDHYGDMDFKVAGTADGITALQMDIKVGGITTEVMRKALDQARRGRLHILAKMHETLAKSRESISAFAPRIVTIRVAKYRGAPADVCAEFFTKWEIVMTTHVCK